MLGQMRNKAVKVVVWILSILLIASFALWGIGDMFRGRTTPTTVAEVGDSEITRNELSNQFRRVVDAMRSRLGSSFDSRQAVQLGLLDETLRRMIDGRLISLEAGRLGLGASEAQIAEAIRRAPEFRGPGDAFDMQRYRAFLSREGLSESAYVAIVRDNLMREQLTGTVAGGAGAPKRLLELVYSYRNEQRVAEVVRIPLGDPSRVAEPDPATLAAFHKEHADQFTAPEYRAATVLYLDPAERAAEMRVPEERIREEYEARLPSLSVPERRRLRQILFQDEAAAQKAAELARQGRSFDEVAQETTKAPPTDLGNLRRNDLPEAIAEPAFKAEQNAVAGPVKTPLGWHLVHVAEVSPGKEPSFEEMRQRIRDDLAREMAVDALINLTSEIDDSLAGGASLEATAEKIGASLRRIEAIDRQGLDRKGESVKGIPKDARFTEQLFSAPQGQVGTLEETEGGGFYLVRVDSVTPPRLRPLEEVRAEVVAAWKKSELGRQAKQKAETVAAAAKQAGALAPAARTAEYEVKTAKPFTRFVRDPSSPVPDSLVRPLFRAKQGEILTAPADDGWVVAELKQIVAAVPGANEAEAQQLRQQLDAAMAEDTLVQYLAALRRRYPVSVNREAVNAISGGAL